MAVTPNASFRIPPALAAAARAAVRADVAELDAAGDPDEARAESPDLPLSVLVRAALAYLAGSTLKDALASAQTRRGPKPKTGAAA